MSASSRTCVALLMSMHHSQPFSNVNSSSPHLCVSMQRTWMSARAGRTITNESTPCAQAAVSSTH
jgi:hypothetical protein